MLCVAGKRRGVSPDLACIVPFETPPILGDPAKGAGAHRLSSHGQCAALLGIVSRVRVHSRSESLPRSLLGGPQPLYSRSTGRPTCEPERPCASGPNRHGIRSVALRTPRVFKWKLVGLRYKGPTSFFVAPAHIWSRIGSFWD